MKYAIGNHIYFLGIGGIGMSAIARFFNEKGVKVSGYDKTVTPLTSQLEAEGISIYYNEDVDRIPKDVQLVVYTPAIPKEHKEYQYYLQNGYSVVKRSDVLQIITQSSLNICVAGTHGKTTISTMTGHLLRHSGFGCNAFLGGIAVNYNRNFWSSENNVCVVEADEYDRSFHKLSPDIAVITAMDADHLDIYGTAEAMEEAFIEFTRKIKPGGWLISKYGLRRVNDLVAENHITYHLNDVEATVHSKNLKVQNGSYLFDAVMNEWVLNDVQLNVGGLHNVENVLAAIAVAHILKIDDDKIRESVKAFKGVKRRFEYVIAPGEGEVVFVDDYAHLPTEISAVLSSCRDETDSWKRVIAVFQPNRFNRMQHMSDTYADCFAAADHVVITDIYSSGTTPIAGVTGKLVVDAIARAHPNTSLAWKPTRAELIQHLATELRSGDLCISMGCGDIETLPDEVITARRALRGGS